MSDVVIWTPVEDEDEAFTPLERTPLGGLANVDTGDAEVGQVLAKIDDDPESYGFVDQTGGGGVALGETSSTAYRGDRGKIAYDHSQTSGNPHGTTAADVGAVTLAGILTAMGEPYYHPGGLLDLSDPGLWTWPEIRVVFGPTQGRVRLPNPDDPDLHPMASLMFMGHVDAEPGSIYWRDDDALIQSTVALIGVFLAALGAGSVDYTSTPLVVTWWTGVTTTLNDAYDTSDVPAVQAFFADLLGPAFTAGMTQPEPTEATFVCPAAEPFTMAVSGPADDVVAALNAAPITPWYAGTVHGADDDAMALDAAIDFPDDLILPSPTGETHTHWNEARPTARAGQVVPVRTDADRPGKWTTIHKPPRTREGQSPIADYVSLHDYLMALAAHAGFPPP